MLKWNFVAMFVSPSLIRFDKFSFQQWHWMSYKCTHMHCTQINAIEGKNLYSCPFLSFFYAFIHMFVDKKVENSTQQLNNVEWNSIVILFTAQNKWNVFSFNCMQFDDYKTSNNTQYTCIPHDICQALELGNFIENCFLKVISIFHTIMQIVRYTIWQLWHFKCCTLIRIKK